MLFLIASLQASHYAVGDMCLFGRVPLLYVIQAGELAALAKFLWKAIVDGDGD